MPANDTNNRFDFNSFEDAENEIARKDDLVELVLGPLGDQIDQGRMEIIAAVKEIKDSLEIVARELARQVKRRE